MKKQLHGQGKNSPGPLHVTLPYIRSDIPIFIAFRALGFVADKDILEHIVYDFGDNEMMDLLRPSIEEAQVIQSQAVALDYIGKRGSAVGVARDKRIKYAREILQRVVALSPTPGRLLNEESVLFGIHDSPFVARFSWTTKKGRQRSLRK